MKSLNAFLAKALIVLVATFSASSFVVAQKQMAENLSVNRVVFIGTDDQNRLVFELQLTNLPEKGNLLLILDGEKNILFEEQINSKTYRRRYKIDRSEMNSDMNMIHFEVINGQPLLKESFRLNYRVECKWDVIKA
jgi:hypothetical protein